jgi:lipoprotein-anchoring transpeptidase ErfK/SrfK
VQRIGTTAPWAGGPVQLMVLDSKRDADDALWLQVQLARRPNGSTAWVLADHVRLARTAWRIEVATSSRTVTVRRAGKLVRRFKAVVGAPGTPTPRGLYAVSERFDLANANSFYGPHVLALTAFSDIFETVGGGPGVVGILGRGGASLASALGTAGSHGCVRIDNAQIVFLARVAIAGTPVAIT